ncbi:MAG: WbqC family protein, partial [Prolixibacteraceae bacterium]|nr:WbqC family protein [Prolixibacteraceae bacterium]
MEKLQQMIFSTAYLGSVQYYAKLAQFQEVYIEQFDSYQKQTYRNRCRILGGNGPLDLIIPVVKNHGQKTLVKDVQIDYQTRWQDIHWRTIV